MSVGVLLAQVVCVAGSNGGQAKPGRQIDGLLRDLGLQRQTVVLNLDEEPVAKELGEPDGQGLGLIELLLDQEGAELAGEAAREAEEPLAVSGEQLFVDAWPIVKALEERH